MGKLTHTVKGPIASFRSADKAPIESLKLHFLPKQEGSGVPSPQNIRNITGWTGCNLNKAKKNLIEPDYVTETVQKGLTISPSTNGIRVSGTASTRTAVRLSKSSKKTKLGVGDKVTFSLYLSGDISECELPFLGYYKSNGVWGGVIGQLSSNNNWKITWTVPNTYTDDSILDSYIYVPQGVTVNFEIGLQGIISPYYSDSYEPYYVETIPLSWPDHGVEYGGYIDPVRGKLVAEYEMLTDTWGNWGEAADQGDGTTLRYKKFTNPVYGNGLGNHNTDYCNVAKYVYANNNGNPHYYIVGQSYNCRVYLPNDFSTDQVIQVIGKLITPIEYDIDPISIQTFLDYNNFWSDTNDDTEVEYCFADRLSERKLIMDTPHIASASGSVASFNTDLKAPLEELKVHFTPVQEGTGDPSPQNERTIHGWTKADVYKAGSNIMDISTLRFTTNNKAQISINNNTAVVTSLVAGNGFPNCSMEGYWDVPEALRGKYVYFGCTSVVQSTSDEEHRSTIVCEFRDENNAFISDPTIITYGSTGSNALARNTQIPSNAVICRLYFRIAQNVSSHPVAVGDKVTFNEFYMRYPNTEHYFENCVASMIPVKFPATKNLYDATTYPLTSSYWINGKTGATSGNNLYACTLSYVPCREFAGKTVTMNTHLASTANNPGIAFYDSSKTYISGIPNNATSGTSLTFAAPSDAYYMRFTVNAGTTNIQIELGSTVTPYEPYGTIYGGYIDLIRGKIVSTHKQFILTGYENIEYSIYSGSVYTAFSEKSILSDSKNGNSIYGWCNMISRGNTTTNQIQRAYLRKSYDGYGLQFYNLTSYWGLTESTVEAFVAKLKALSDAGTPFQLVYELATPIEYDLTPETLKSLIGQNNIFADTNGNVDVKYWTH